MTDDDVDAVIQSNNDNIPAVSHLDAAGLEWLRSMASTAAIAEVDGQLAGWFIVLHPGEAYDSLNYRWFDSTMTDFAYLDRIVVDPAHRRSGIGRACYQWLLDELRGTATQLCCEVNIRPLNQSSLDFHHSLGFVEVGQQDTDGGSKRVVLLARGVDLR